MPLQPLCLDSHFGEPRVRLYPEAADQTFNEWELVYLDEATKEVTGCDTDPALVIGVVLAPATGVQGSPTPVAVLDGDDLISLQKYETVELELVPDATDDLDVLESYILTRVSRGDQYNPDYVWVLDAAGAGNGFVESIDQKAPVGTEEGRLICKISEVLQLEGAISQN